MADMSLQGGQLVCTRWRLRGRLAEAGNARSWEAEDVGTRGRVAIKFFARPAASDTGARRRFEREVRSIGKARSPHLVQVVDHGQTENGLPFIVTELLHGQDLGRLLSRVGVLGLIETSLILDQVCRGLSHVHAVGLVHGDIKPEAIFLSSAPGNRYFVKLLDFGFAKPLASEGGTCPCLSPEHLHPPQRVDARSDIWALGVLTYRMLTGVWPFEADSGATLAERVRSATYIPIRVRRRDLPLELDAWFAHTLQAELALRYQTIEQAREGFERVVCVYTSGMLAETRPKLTLNADVQGSSSIIVPAPERPRPELRSAWHAAVWIAVLLGLACFALRDPWGDSVPGSTLDALGVYLLRPLRAVGMRLGQATQPSTPPADLAGMRADNHGFSASSLVTPPPSVEAAPKSAQSTAQSTAGSSPVRLGAATAERRARTQRPRDKPVRPSGARAVSSPDSGSHAATARAELDDLSPALPAPNHVYRGF